jgi:hypothetical protein
MTSWQKNLVTTLHASALLVLCLPGAAQQTNSVGDCSTLKYKPHRSASLCGKATVCAGDICGGPSVYGFDKDFEVVLRDSRGKELETKSLSREDDTFCFSGRSDGNYQLAFVLHKNNVPEAARVFPTRYKHNSDKPNDAMYMVEVTCPKASQ